MSRERTLLKLKNNIAKYRKEAGLSQAGLTKLSGISKIMITALENKRVIVPSDPTVNALCKALNKTVGELFYL